MDPFIVVLIATIVGILVRTLVKYLALIAGGQITVFDKRYLAGAILATIVAVVAGVGEALAFQIPSTGMSNTLLGLTAFWQAYGVNSLVASATPESTPT
jgi:hypothetical protein